MNTFTSLWIQPWQVFSTDRLEYTVNKVSDHEIEVTHQDRNEVSLEANSSTQTIKSIATLLHWGATSNNTDVQSKLDEIRAKDSEKMIQIKDKCSAELLDLLWKLFNWKSLYEVLDGKVCFLGYGKNKEDEQTPDWSYLKYVTDDVAWFEILSQFFSKDSKHVYYGGGEIGNADPATFQVIGDSQYGYDNRKIFYKDKTVETTKMRDKIESFDVLRHNIIRIESSWTNSRWNTEEKKTESLNETAIPLYYNGEEVKFIVEEIEDLEHHDEFETPWFYFDWINVYHEEWNYQAWKELVNLTEKHSWKQWEDIKERIWWRDLDVYYFTIDNRRYEINGDGILEEKDTTTL